jgi:hypothetical protein
MAKANRMLREKREHDSTEFGNEVKPRETWSWLVN